MGITKIIRLLLLVVLTASCSSGDSGALAPGNSLTYNRNGIDVAISSVEGSISEDNIAITAVTSEGKRFQFLFNKYGNLGKVMETTIFGDPDPWYQNYKHFSSHFFTFNMISYDESTHRVKATYSGTLYQDENSLTSGSITVSGEFDVVCTRVYPTVTGLGDTCKMNGVDWYSTRNFWNGGDAINFILGELSDDEFMIGLGFDSTNNEPGTYNFTASTSTNFVHLSKFNPTTLTYTHYNCVGSLVVTSKISAGAETFMAYYIGGTYSFTATNPNDASEVIHVTNGKFRRRYEPYSN